jgi:hypothetical protein
MIQPLTTVSSATMGVTALNRIHAMMEYVRVLLSQTAACHTVNAMTAIVVQPILASVIAVRTTRWYATMAMFVLKIIVTQLCPRELIVPPCELQKHAWMDVLMGLIMTWMERLTVRIPIARMIPIASSRYVMMGLIMTWMERLTVRIPIAQMIKIVLRIVMMGLTMTPMAMSTVMTKNAPASHHAKKSYL